MIREVEGEVRLVDHGEGYGYGLESVLVRGIMTVTIPSFFASCWLLGLVMDGLLIPPFSSDCMYSFLGGHGNCIHDDGGMFVLSEKHCPPPPAHQRLLV